VQPDSAEFGSDGVVQLHWSDGSDALIDMLQTAMVFKIPLDGFVGVPEFAVLGIDIRHDDPLVELRESGHYHYRLGRRSVTVHGKATKS